MFASKGTKKLNVSKLYNLYHSSFLQKLVCSERAGTKEGERTAKGYRRPQQRRLTMLVQGGLCRAAAKVERASVGPRSLPSPGSSAPPPALALPSTPSPSLQPGSSPSHPRVLAYENRPLSILSGLYTPKTNLNDPPQFSPSTNSKFSMLNSILHPYSKGKFSKQNFLNVT